MNVGIIGAGTMGSGIAQVAATADCKVYLFDLKESVLKKSREKLAKVMTRLIEKGKYSKEEADRIQTNIVYRTQLSDFADCDLVIEAIVENSDVKRSVFRDIEMIVNENCILASNTSSLSIASLAASISKPERFIGIHFFNPAPLMKLVEIVPAIQTNNEVTTQVRRIIKDWQKITVLAKDTPGFIVNKVARPFYGEALRIYEEGIADFATIDWAMKKHGGFRMGPFELMDFIGNDINYTVTETVFKAFYYDDRYKPSFTQKRMAEAGYLGRKSGRGYYHYTDDAEPPKPVQDDQLGKYILERILVMLINEAADTLHFNIASKEDIDTAMTKGVNYPKGLFEWADELGIDRCVKKIDFLYDLYHEDRYRCSPLLRKMNKLKETFYQ